MIWEVENVLIDSCKFKLPKRLPNRVDDDINWTVIIVEATKAPIECPKNAKETKVLSKNIFTNLKFLA